MINELNNIMISDEISEEDLDELTLTDLEADLEMTLNKVLDKI